MTDFSDYIHILARGPRSRGDLTREQAQDALMQLLNGTASDVQAAALLVALRIKGETPDEFIGLISAARNALQGKLPTLPVDIDWPCYAGKTRQPLWFLLAAKLLAQNGITILLHDAPPASGNRVYARQLLDGLGIPSASDVATLPDLLAQSGIVHIGLEVLLPRLTELLTLREQLGVRSLLNSVVRCLNPTRACLSLQSVFHPAYLELHAAAAAHFASETTLTFKGDGGEAEVRPYANTKLTLVQNNEEIQEILPALIDKPDNEVPSLQALQSLWRGDNTCAHGELAVIQTSAAILWASGRATDLDAARKSARIFWEERLEIG